MPGFEAFDVFVSYAKKDRAKVEPLVNLLRTKQLKVWWAEELRTGRRWRVEIEERMEAARHVLVVWTKDAVKADSFVREEAQYAAEMDKLVHVRVENVRPPLGFREFHYEDLSGWTGQPSHQGVDSLLTVIAPVQPAPGPVVGPGALSAPEGPRETTQPKGHENAAPHASLQGRAVATDLLSLANSVAAAALAGNPADLAAATSLFTSALTTTAAVLEVGDVEGLLETLRNRRAHESVVEIAEVLLCRDEATNKVRRLYAQSLIDLGRVNLAVGLLKSTFDRVGTGDDKKEYAEVMGLLGRAHKQLYVNDRRRPRSGASENALRMSMGYYAEALLDKPVEADVWNGINLVALQALADRDGLIVRRYVEPAAAARAMIKAIGPDTSDPWENATLGEAYVALGDWDNAAQHYGRFLANEGTTPFHINSALRQLKEVWQLQPGSDGAGQLLLGVEARLASAAGGAITLASAEIGTRRQATQAPSLPVFDRLLSDSTIKDAQFGNVLPESIVGEFKARPREWFELLLKRSASVGRVKAGVHTIGTGFVVRGGDLAPALGNELMFLTNAHVVSGGKAADGLQRIGLTSVSSMKPEQIRIAFDAASAPQPAGGHACKLVWESPIAEHDAVLLRFTAPVTGIEAMPIASALPPVKVQGFNNTPRYSRVFVIGHPDGRPLEISIEDCELLDAGPKSLLGEAFKHIQFLHYRTPTEPGNSGSPVFEELGWEVIGLHHFGSGARNGKIASLDGRQQRQANEGISILSIAAALRRDLGMS